MELDLPRRPPPSKEALTTVRTFTISGPEWKKYLEWRADHNLTCLISPEKQYAHFEKTGEHLTGAIGGGETFAFSPTGLGVSITVRCNKCEIECNITDYDLW